MQSHPEHGDKERTTQMGTSPITNTGPIGIEQINTTFYVYGSGIGFATIQAAVDFIRTYNSSVGEVRIAHGHGYSEDISTITGGAISIILIDQRDGSNQHYLWNGTQYVPQIFTQLAEIFAPFYFATDFIDTPEWPTESLGIDFLPSLNAGRLLAKSNNANLATIEIGGIDSTGRNILYLVCSEPTGVGSGIANFNVPVNINGDVTANDAEFDTCVVGESPVRTFANTPDGPGQGMVWPPIGIPVSQGSTWQATSIDPATIAYLNETNNFTMPQRVQTSDVVVQTDTIDTAHPNARLTSQNMTSTAIRGGFQFDGFSSDVSQQGTYLMMWQDTNGLHSSFPNSGLDVNGILRTTYNAFAGANTGTVGGVQLAWNVSAASGETDFINNSQGAAGGFRWYNGPSNVPINSSSTPMMELDNPGNLTLQGSIDTMGQASYIQAGNAGVPGTAGQLITRFVAAVSGQAGVSYAGQFNIGTFSSTTPASSIGDTLQISHLSVGPDGASGPLLLIDRAATLTVAANQFRIGARQANVWTAGSPSLNCDNVSVILNAAPQGAIFFNWDQGQGEVFFGTGVPGVEAAHIDSGGNAHFNGTITAGTKSFRVTHPLDDTKDLTHSCIEGPEIAVYYRGESVTESGVATITLPDYFEALTQKEGRTVQLTELYEGEDNPMFGNFLAAGRIKDGTFNVRTSSHVAVKFYWEVMAIRADVPTLEVVTEKSTRPRGTRPYDGTENLPRTERNRTPQAGEPKSKKVRT
jgi:hypothetical protein